MSTGLQHRATILGIKVEVTAGTPVKPASTTDFVALQSGFQMQPNFETLSNDELRSSIGRSKPILGKERPTFSMSHYLRHSGVEGTAPNFGLFLKAVLGSTSSNGTQRTTTVGSGVGSIILGAGGSDFARGKAVLVKDGTNGYSIRPVESVSSNTLTPAFNLANAPATGIGVGKCVNYAPANVDHPTISFWLYRANSGATEMMAGSLCTQYQLDVKAGQMIQQTFNFEGSKYGFNPVEITGGDKYLDFEDAAAAEKNISITEKIYKDPQELCDAVNTAIAALGLSETITMSYVDTTGKYKFTSNGAAFKLLWNTGTNTGNTIGAAIGFSVAADDTGALTYTSDNAVSQAASYTPAYDSADPLVAKNQEVLMGDATDTTHLQGCDEMSLQITDTIADVEDVGQESGVLAKIVTERQAVVTIKKLLNQYEAKNFYRYRDNQRVKFCYNFGSKSGGNWVAGKCGNVYLPDATITKFNLADKNGLIQMEMELTAYVDATITTGEVYINFL